MKQEIIPPESCEENSVAVKKELINIGSCDQNLPDNIIIKKEIIPDDEPILIEFVCELCSKVSTIHRMFLLFKKLFFSLMTIKRITVLMSVESIRKRTFLVTYVTKNLLSCTS